MVVALGILCVVVDIAFLSVSTYLRTYRLSGDAHRIASKLALARIRSAGDFDQARISFDVTAKTYQLELCNKTTSSFQIEESALPLSPEITFGYGTITQGPIPSQATIAQTSPITFNSRGVPITLSGVGCTGCGGNCVSTSTANNAIYVTNKQGASYAITVNLGGKIDVWQYQKNAWAATSF
jgi:Tfp pilus assembly protein FimT